MRKDVSFATAVAISAATLLLASGTAQSDQLLIEKFENRPQSLITPIIEGKHCYICVVREDSKCTKWEEISCGDIIIKNVAGASVYVNKKTGKRVWLKGMSAPAAPSRQ